MNKKQEQLGMNPSTASHKLNKDILFSLIKDSHVCYRCEQPLTRDDFSIEHKEAWLDSDDPIGKFFDLNNIGFSHLSCNSKAARKPCKVYESAEERNRQHCNRRYAAKPIKERQERRRQQYLKFGR